MFLLWSWLWVGSDRDACFSQNKVALDKIPYQEVRTSFLLLQDACPRLSSWVEAKSHRAEKAEQMVGQFLTRSKTVQWSCVNVEPRMRETFLRYLV